jgi:hypothetical protein
MDSKTKVAPFVYKQTNVKHTDEQQPQRQPEPAFHSTPPEIMWSSKSAILFDKKSFKPGVPNSGLHERDTALIRKQLNGIETIELR